MGAVMCGRLRFCKVQLSEPDWRAVSPLTCLLQTFLSCARLASASSW